VSLKLFACGDVVNSTAKKDFINDELINFIKSSDIAICNFEAPIETINMEAINKAGPHVYQSKKSIQYLSEVGFNIVSLANNHIYDYGQEALENTLLELKKYSVDFIGGGKDFKDTYATKIIDKNGIKIGLLAAAENEFGCLYEEQNRGGYAWLFHPLIEDNIRALKPEVDFVVLISHAGVENIELPIKEWRDRYKRLCDVGVDVIVGHHPHVPQGFEKYNDSIIFYSLGNFYFDTAGFQDKSDDSYSVALEFNKDGSKSFKIIYHKKINYSTCMVGKLEVDFDLSYLNSILGNDYMTRNDEISLKLFNQYYYGYYRSALGSMPKKTNLLNIVKWMLKKIVFSSKNQGNRDLLLLHNIKIDSHRFVVQRALSLITEKDK
jgi:poly-gamma-glutamate synthesis protein (capsule biosynthesis protein)